MTSTATPSPAVTAAKGRHRIRAVPLVCGILLLFVFLVTVTGQALAPHDPGAQNPALSVSAPGPGHLLGTDQLGRDVLSQLIGGTRSALLGPLVVALGCLAVGAGLGMAGAYFGGITDSLVGRFADLVYALPALLIAIVAVGVLGGGYWVTAAVLLVLSVPGQIRLCRSATMVHVRLPYVDAARTLGLSPWRILLRHILPNTLPTVFATFLLDFVGALIGFTAMSYLGLGVPGGSPDWGRMLADGQALIAENPWLSMAPAVLLCLTAASASLLGDWLQEQLDRRGDRT
ncbi:ABC transporter permease [Streptomyces sp. CLV115]|uniref:ABC transporter permease n=1 Tax=Streptomyces sp. CLV115 TaxID=3138502 RepID=UPI00313CF46D